MRSVLCVILLPWVRSEIFQKTGRRILVQLCDENIAIIDECWSVVQLDLGGAKWAVKGTAYHANLLLYVHWQGY
jgi:hypothetical protein